MLRRGRLLRSGRVERLLKCHGMLRHGRRLRHSGVEPLLKTSGC